MVLKCSKTSGISKKGQESKGKNLNFVGTQFVDDVRCLKEVKGPKTNENVAQKRVFQFVFFFYVPKMTHIS